jgi:hypothetical protein
MPELPAEPPPSVKPRSRRSNSVGHTGKTVGLPPRFFLYTLDQIAGMLNISLETLKASYVYFEGRSTYLKQSGQISARNIAPSDKPPVWRVLDTELVRWMRVKGFRYVQTGRFEDDRRALGD